MGNSFSEIKYEVKSNAAWITLNRPDAFNSFTPEMIKEVTSALKRANRDQDVRAVVITGEGRAFCAGQDIKTVDENTDYSGLLRNYYHPMVKALEAVTKPTIAAVNGVAAGAGMSLALATDFRIVHEKSSFVSAFMGIGLIPDSGFIYNLPRMIGYTKALEIATLDKQISGEEAKELGLATELVALDDWAEKVEKFVDRLANLPTAAFSLIKRYMMDSMHNPLDPLLEQEAQAQQTAALTADHKEGLQAFIEKRKPVFTGK